MKDFEAFYSVMMKLAPSLEAMGAEIAELQALCQKLVADTRGQNWEDLNPETQERVRVLGQQFVTFAEQTRDMFTLED